MFIKIGYDMKFDTVPGVAMNLALHTHPSRDADLLNPEKIHIEDEKGRPVPAEIMLDCFGNRISRTVSTGKSLRIWTENILRDSGQPDRVPKNPAEGEQAPPAKLPADVMQYLLSSRYCEVDLLQERAWELFGKLKPGWARAKAVVDWVHDYLTFGYEYARRTKTAVDAWHERRGVCRDFQHLCITLHRCLNLPARYVTGYLGDIGVPYNPARMDFSAWHEVFLGGQWWALDGRFNQARIGRILMATGRDAVDVALTTQFGPAQLTEFKVIAEEVSPQVFTAPRPARVKLTRSVIKPPTRRRLSGSATR